LECEQSLFRTFFPALAGKKVLKTDLWDEAKNTQILRWVADQNASVFGIDISMAMVQAAKAIFPENLPARCIVSDVRCIAFAAESFDLIYSMGTIEHFREYREAVAECYRVLRPGGLLFMGVPNRHDPFLRPLLVRLLRAMKLYAYGYERSFSRTALENILNEAGFKILGVSGVLFMPGLLRMLDLWLYVTFPKATKLTVPLIRPFAYLYRRFPSVRRHSYLICSIARKPL
jgi:SAM-dependent methyltransferase